MTAVHQADLGARVEVAGLTRSFGPVQAVAGVDLSLSPASFTALLGPSGCGKSTLLALLAGLQRPEAGVIRIDDRPVDHVPTEDRPIGLVFQKPLLFPHLNVRDNVAFGLRMHKSRRRQARERARELLDQVGLLGFDERRVGELSGGQEQRVALARALALEPRLLLLDEPFSQLDPDLRARMRQLVRTLTAEAKITTLFVTHDLGEAVDIADDIVLMLAGRIEGQGSPEVFYRRPPTLAAARFFDAGNEIEGATREGRFHAPGLLAPVSFEEPGSDGPSVLVVRPESLRLRTGPENPGGVCVRAYPLGVRFAGTHLVLDASTDNGSRVRAHLPPGTTITDDGPLLLAADASACTIFPRTAP